MSYMVLSGPKANFTELKACWAQMFTWVLRVLSGSYVLASNRDISEPLRNSNFWGYVIVCN